MVGELDALYADGREVSHQALREIPELENAIKEALRLHPPLILLMRKVVHDFHYKDWVVPAGKLVGRLARRLEPPARVLPRPGPLRPRPLRARAARRTRSCSPGSRSAPAATAAWARRSR